MEYKELAASAVNAKQRALPTYSKFHVGAALLTKAGKVFNGANIETSSYSLTICAERVAVFKAVYDGEREFSAVAIAADTEDFCPPCGACRQVLFDLCGNIDVILVNKKEELKTIKLSELLPLAFNDDILKKEL
jgi:cytidine deaminase